MSAVGNTNYAKFHMKTYEEGEEVSTQECLHEGGFEVHAA